MKLLRLIPALLLAACAHAPQQPLPASTQEALYQDALRSIAEGRRSDASRELMRLIDKEPLHAGAWLDLAKTQCALGHADEAEHMFATIETRFAPSRAILELIAEAREQGCSRWRPASMFSFAAGRGVDQNVNQGATTARYVIDAPGGQVEYELDEDFRPMHDQYSALWGDYTREITPNGSTAFVQFAARHNDHLRQYDSGSLFAGLESPWRLGRWTVRTTGTVGLVTLGGQLYQRQAQLQARVAVPLPLPPALQLSVLAGAGYNDFVTLSNFNARTAELRAVLAWRRQEAYASASIGALGDRALAQRPGGDRHGVFASVLVRRRLAGPLTGELAYTHQTWDSKLPYSPGLIEQVRAQSTGVARASLSWALSRNQSLQLEARQVRNRENISIFQYNNRQLQLSWQWQGP
jgi:hypothetical protein